MSVESSFVPCLCDDGIE